MAKKVLTGLGALVLVAVTAAYAYWPAEARAYRSAWRQTVDSRFVDSPQARLHYVRDGAGSPVILLAPSSGWAVLWQWQLEVLGRSHTVYAVDLPGNTGYTRLKGSFRYDLDGITGVLWVLTDGLLEEIYAPMTLRENVRAVYFRAVY